MQTSLVEPHRSSRDGSAADTILRSCVHCGFCSATCPTYQISGNELDSPRGRIYLIKQLLEGQAAGETARYHLDRCLSCRNCETTCPSGVRYSHLLDIGRRALAQQQPRRWPQRLLYWMLRRLLPWQRGLAWGVTLARPLRRFLPSTIRAALPPAQRPLPAAMIATPAVTEPTTPPPAATAARRMLLLTSCGQQAVTPATNAAATRLLAKLGITLETVATAGCCGALSHHLEAEDEARRLARRNIDAWLPLLDSGAEALLITASGCGTQVREYPQLLAEDSDYLPRAERIAAATRDLLEVVSVEAQDRIQPCGDQLPVAIHTPCSLQHGQSLGGRIEPLLEAAGYQLLPVADSHLCCGSAGPYSLLQPTLAGALRQRKLSALEAHQPVLIVTANVGCQMHLQSGTERPVRHWVELLEGAVV